MGWILIVTALLVMVPVVLQLRAGETRFRDFGGYVLFAIGLVLVGAAERWATGTTGQAMTLSGLASVIFGLLVARPGRPC